MAAERIGQRVHGGDGGIGEGLAGQHRAEQHRAPRLAVRPVPAGGLDRPPRGAAAPRGPSAFETGLAFGEAEV